MRTPETVEVTPLPGLVDAEVNVPGSKSLTNRALVCAALAEGRSRLVGALHADDTEAMVSCLGRLGVADLAALDGLPIPEVVEVTGDPGRMAGAEDVSLDARLSGTTSRFVLPLLGPARGPVRLDGAPSLRERPMADGIAALRALGAAVAEEGEPGRLPVIVEGVGPEHTSGPRQVAVAGAASSQFLSGLLLSGPMWPGGLAVRVDGPLVSLPYVTMTVAVMRAFGAEVSESAAGWTVAPVLYRPTDYRIEPDASAASYFFAAAAIVGGRVTVDGLGRGSLQGDLAFVDVLEQMGCTVRRSETSTTVERSGELRGVDVDMGALSDTAQTLAAVAVFADSPTRVRGIGFIRHKETDRVGNVVAELRRCGIRAEEEPDGFLIHPGEPRPATVQTYDDHRMAMSFALLGLGVPGIRIADPGCVAKTFPGFWTALDQLG